MADDEYSFVPTGKLKLKAEKEAKRKRKLQDSQVSQPDAPPKSVKVSELQESGSAKSDSNVPKAANLPRSTTARKTKAELAFEETRRKRLLEELAKRPPKSHKERVLALNQHLDSLTEHFDIPKVSWTK